MGRFYLEGLRCGVVFAASCSFHACMFHFSIVSGILRFERSAEKREDVKKRDSDENQSVFGSCLA